MVKAKMAFTITISISTRITGVLRFDYGRKPFIRSLKGLIKIQTYKQVHTPTNRFTFVHAHREREREREREDHHIWKCVSIYLAHQFMEQIYLK
jgi:hypothetical protein